MSHQRKTTEWPKLYPFRGERLSINEIARKVGLSHQLIRKRMSLGWALEDLGKTKLTPKECAMAGAAGYRARYRARYPTGSNAKKTSTKT